MNKDDIKEEFEAWFKKHEKLFTEEKFDNRQVAYASWLDGYYKGCTRLIREEEAL